MGIFRKEPEPIERHVNLNDAFAEELRHAPPLRRPANEFAPRGRQVEQVESYAAIALQTLDDKEAKLDAAYKEAKDRNQSIRDLLMRIRRDEIERLERETKVIKAHTETFAELEERVRELYRVPAEEPPPAEPAQDLDQQQAAKDTPEAA